MSADPGDLANLADLALPPPPALWPLAIGVWIIVAALAAALAIFVWRALKRHRADAYLRAASAELDRLAGAPPGDAPDHAEAVSAVLKRAAIVAYGRERVAALTGAAWVGFLSDTGPPGESSRAMAGLAARRADQPGDPAAAAGQLIAGARAWLRLQRGRAATEA